MQFSFLHPKKLRLFLIQRPERMDFHTQIAHPKMESALRSFTLCQNLFYNCLQALILAVVPEILIKALSCQSTLNQLAIQVL